jgi:hypothetical protein
MSEKNYPHAVPQALKIWFVIHFVVDMLFAIPMMFAPIFTLELFGWGNVEPITTRLVAAALFGIGIESYLGRNASLENFQEMLNLKIIWSLGAIATFSIAILTDFQNWPPFGWALLGIFILFNSVWIYWRWKLR